jgi:hypothetical protein
MNGAHINLVWRWLQQRRRKVIFLTVANVPILTRLYVARVTRREFRHLELRYAFRRRLQIFAERWHSRWEHARECIAFRTRALRRQVSYGLFSIIDAEAARLTASGVSPGRSIDLVGFRAMRTGRSVWRRQFARIYPVIWHQAARCAPALNAIDRGAAAETVVAILGLKFPGWNRYLRMETKTISTIPRWQRIEALRQVGFGLAPERRPSAGEEWALWRWCGALAPKAAVQGWPSVRRVLARIAVERELIRREAEFDPCDNQMMRRLRAALQLDVLVPHLRPELLARRSFSHIMEIASSAFEKPRRGLPSSIAHTLASIAAWGPKLPTITLGGFVFRPLADTIGFIEEGIRMKNCAHTYEGLCRAGADHFLSIWDAESGKRVADALIGVSKLGSGVSKHALVDIKGPCNESVSDHRLHTAMRLWIQMADAGTLGDIDERRQPTLPGLDQIEHHSPVKRRLKGLVVDTNWIEQISGLTGMVLETSAAAIASELGDIDVIQQMDPRGSSDFDRAFVDAVTYVISTRWIAERRHCLIVGRPPSCTTWLSQSLSFIAIANGYSVGVWHLSDIIGELYDFVDDTACDEYSLEFLKYDLESVSKVMRPGRGVGRAA